MADIAIFRINYKSDFILTLQSDAGWMTPFCIKFWTGAPSQAYFAGYDGTTYTHCAPVEGEPTKLLVQFDDHHLPIGDLKFQIGYHFTVADFPTSIEDEVINQAAVIIDNDGEQQQVMLDFNGETAPEIQFSLPAYANEAQRIANEQARIAAEQQRISNEEARITAEQTRQQNEQQRINQEQQRISQEQQRVNAEAERVSDFASLKTESEAATAAANIAATLANEKAQLADDKAALAQAAATLANAKAQLAADKAALAQAAATLANEKAALAQQKAEYAQEQGDVAKTEAEAAHALNNEVREDEDARKEAEQTRQQQETARQQAEAARETAYEQAEAGRNTSFQQAESARTTAFNNQLQQQQTAYTEAEAARETAFNEAETERDAKVDEKVADITNLQAQLGYFVCDTAAATAAKTIAATGYALTTGGNIRIKMTNANTADAVTLNINSTGAKALYYNGAQASSTNSWEAGEVIEVYYDGTDFYANNVAGGSSNSLLRFKGSVTANEVKQYSFNGVVGLSYRLFNGSEDAISALYLYDEATGTIDNTPLLTDIEPNTYADFCFTHDSNKIGIVWSGSESAGWLTATCISKIPSTINPRLYGTRILGYFLSMSDGLPAKAGDNSWEYIDYYFEVEPGSTIRLSGFSDFHNVVANYVFYDEQKNVLSQGAGNGIINVPVDAKYVRFGGSSSGTINVKGIKNIYNYNINEILDDIITENEKQNEILSTLVVQELISSVNTITNKFLKTDGTTYLYPTGAYLIYNIEVGKTYYITSTAPANLNEGYAAYWFVDANGAMLSCQEFGTGDDDLPDTFIDIPIVAPEGAVKLYLQSGTAYVNTSQVKVDKTFAELAPQIITNTNNINNILNFNVLLNYVNVDNGKWLKTDGTTYLYPTGAYLIYNIEVGKTYYITSTAPANLNEGYAAYWFVDANGAMLSCQEFGTGDDDLPDTFIDIPIVAPEGAVKLYLQSDTNTIDKAAVSEPINYYYFTDFVLNNLTKISSDIDTINEALGIQQSLELFIPDEFDIIVNKPVQIFKYPLTLLSDYQAYSISISTVGTGITCTCTKRFATINATAASTYTLKIVVLNDNLKVLAEKTVIIHANTAVSPATMKNVLLIGDSETAGVGGIPYANEVKRLLTSNDVATNTLPAGLGLSNIQLIGSNGASVARHEGYGGWTCASFLGSSSPFYVNGAIDFNAYLAKDNIYDNAEFKGVDLIYITLGINNIVDATVVNGKLVLSNQAHKSGLISLLSKIREQIVEGSGTYANPNLKVVLLSYVFTDTDAYDYSHNTLYSDGNIMAMRYVACAKANAEVAAMDEFSGFVTAKILSAQIDSENAYPKVTNIKSNPYMDAYETNTYEGVHPTTIGYRMFGASVVNDIIGEF